MFELLADDPIGCLPSTCLVIVGAFLGAVVGFLKALFLTTMETKIVPLTPFVVQHAGLGMSFAATIRLAAGKWLTWRNHFGRLNGLNHYLPLSAAGVFVAALLLVVGPGMGVSFPCSASLATAIVVFPFIQALAGDIGLFAALCPFILLSLAIELPWGIATFLLILILDALHIRRFSLLEPGQVFWQGRNVLVRFRRRATPAEVEDALRCAVNERFERSKELRNQ